MALDNTRINILILNVLEILDNLILTLTHFFVKWGPPQAKHSTLFLVDYVAWLQTFVLPASSAGLKWQISGLTLPLKVEFSPLSWNIACLCCFLLIFHFEVVHRIVLFCSELPHFLNCCFHWISNFRCFFVYQIFFT